MTSMTTQQPGPPGTLPGSTSPRHKISRHQITGSTPAKPTRIVRTEASSTSGGIFEISPKGQTKLKQSATRTVYKEYLKRLNPAAQTRFIVNKKAQFTMMRDHVGAKRPDSCPKIKQEDLPIALEILDEMEKDLDNIRKEPIAQTINYDFLKSAVDQSTAQVLKRAVAEESGQGGFISEANRIITSDPHAVLLLRAHFNVQIGRQGTGRIEPKE